MRPSRTKPMSAPGQFETSSFAGWMSVKRLKAEIRAAIVARQGRFALIMAKCFHGYTAACRRAAVGAQPKSTVPPLPVAVMFEPTRSKPGLNGNVPALPVEAAFALPQGLLQGHRVSNAALRADSRGNPPYPPLDPGAANRVGSAGG